MEQLYYVAETGKGLPLLLHINKEKRTMLIGPAILSSRAQ
jgi:hypothetical protein